MCEGCEDLTEVLYGNAPLCRSSANHDTVRAGHGWLSHILTVEALLAVTIGALLANLAAYSAIFSLGLAALSISLMAAIGLNAVGLLKRFIFPSYLALVAVATQIFLRGDTALLSLGPIVAYQEGLVHGLLLGSKIVAGAAVVFLFGTALRAPRVLSLMAQSPTELSSWHRLAAKLHLPQSLTETALLTYRYLFVLADEAQRIREAQLCRLGHTTSRSRVSSLSTLAGMVVIRCYDRAEAVNESMMLRGYGNATVSEQVTGKDITSLFFAAIATALLVALGQTL